MPSGQGFEDPRDKTTSSSTNKNDPSQDGTDLALANGPNGPDTCYQDNGSFALGAQYLGGLTNSTRACSAGMSWMKQQYKFHSGSKPSELQGFIDHAHNEGFKILLSIPGEFRPSSIDYNGYVNFIEGVAALGPDAIEIWNEPNLDMEWPAGKISASDYVNKLLQPSYDAIKAVNQDIMVVSAAPAPTGYFGGNCSAEGCDDEPYLREMANAGAEASLDCVGAHYNAGATAPDQSTGHPADDGQHHHSWYLKPLLDLYSSIIAKPICVTEFGYLSGEGYGSVPGGFSWAANISLEQHASWLAQATKIMATEYSDVRLGIVWNMDFTSWGDDPMGGYAIIRPDGSCPACETLKNTMASIQ
ncbi:MAG: hypothetical protein IPJ88_02890 [Myxococcales bacterium]|nr:MAG: hypothetical protein IPJ88_02890 [Myxococcales bacterium]